MTSPSGRAAPRGPEVLEWSVATAALIGGAGVMVVGCRYGLSNPTGVGAGFFPLVAGTLIALAGALWLVQLAVARRSVGSTEGSDFPDRAGWVRVAVIVTAILLAALVLPVVGYTVTMTLMVAGVLFFASERRWWLSLLLGVGAAVASRLVFENWLGTALPEAGIELIARLGL